MQISSGYMAPALASSKETLLALFPAMHPLAACPRGGADLAGTWAETSALPLPDRGAPAASRARCGGWRLLQV